MHLFLFFIYVFYILLISSHPKPFKLAISARSEKALALLNAANEEHPFQGSDAKEIYEALKAAGSGVYAEGR